MRIFIAALGTETNTFSPLPTGRKTFEETLWVRRDASLSSDNYFVLPLVEWRRLAEATGDTVIESLSAFAQPAGRTVQAVWEELRDTLLGDLQAAGPLDLVLLNLHGAMASEGCDDCEGELVEMVRHVVGPDVTVGVEFDLHCHISERLMRNADLLVLYKEYPHTDVAERGAELFDLARRTVLGEIRPVMALRDLRMLDVWRTSDAPVRALVDWMQAAERRDKVLSVSFGHGFPWADVPDVGAKIASGSCAKPTRRTSSTWLRRWRRLPAAMAARWWPISRTMPGAARRATRPSCSSHCSRRKPSGRCSGCCGTRRR